MTSKCPEKEKNYLSHFLCLPPSLYPSQPHSSHYLNSTLHSLSPSLPTYTPHSSYSLHTYSSTLHSSCLPSLSLAHTSLLPLTPHLQLHSALTLSHTSLLPLTPHLQLHSAPHLTPPTYSTPTTPLCTHPTCPLSLCPTLNHSSSLLTALNPHPQLTTAI